MASANSKTIVLGSKVKDRITGFMGVAVARTVYLNMCDRYTVQPGVNDKGEIPAAFAIDVDDLEIIVAAKPAKPVHTGGPAERVERASSKR